MQCPAKMDFFPRVSSLWVNWIDISVTYNNSSLLIFIVFMFSHNTFCWRSKAAIFSTRKYSNGNVWFLFSQIHTRAFNLSKFGKHSTRCLSSRRWLLISSIRRGCGDNNWKSSNSNVMLLLVNNFWLEKLICGLFSRVEQVKKYDNFIKIKISAKNVIFFTRGYVHMY